MINKETIEKVLHSGYNNYELVNIISKRGRQLIDEKSSMISKKGKSEITMATLEFEKNNFKIIKKENEEDKKN